MLTPAQLVTLRAYIDNDLTLSAIPNNTDGAFAVAAILNQSADPAFVVWRTAVPLDEIMRNGMDWTRVDNLSVGKARIWDWLSRLGTLNPAQANVRAGIDATWGGTAGDLAVRASVYTHCKRSATVAEKLYATGTGSAAVPGTLAFEGLVTFNDVENARAN